MHRDVLGLTFAELLVSLAVAAILFGVATPRIAMMLGAIRLPLGTRQLASDLNMARTTAVLRNTRGRMTFSGNAYTTRYDAGEPREVRGALPAGVRIARVPRSGAVRFFPTGRADNATVVVAGANGRRRSVVINQRGRVVIR